MHIDHTPIDVEFVDATGQVHMRTVWLSLAMDAASRAVVGFFLSFEKPSYRSCMMVFRDVIRRHGRAPDMLMVDNGKEFHSHAFRRLCALYRVALRFRPPAEARFGSTLERLFGTTASQLFHNLDGNKELARHFRSITKSVQPKNFARWTLPAIHGALDFYYSQLYGKDNHPAHGQPPVEFFQRRLTETGARLTRQVRFDRTLMIETCPSVSPKGTRVVDGQRGVKIGWIWYWSDAFRNPNLDGKTVSIRIDPWDPRHVYALVDSRWELCRSKLVGRLSRLTEIELRYAFETMERTEGVKKKALTKEMLQQWSDLLKPENFDPRLRLEQHEMAVVYEPLKMTSVAFAEHGRAEDALLPPTSPDPTKNSTASNKTPDAPVDDQNESNPITTAEHLDIPEGEEVETF